MRTCAVLLLSLASQIACAAGAPLPKPVKLTLDAVAAVCTEVEGKPNTADAIKRVDLNTDSHEDYVLDVGSVNCDGAASVYGDREKGVMVFVGDGKGGATEAFNEPSFGIRLDGSGAESKLWLTLMGSMCGKKPAADFASEDFCERALQWNAKTRRFDFAPVSTVRMIE